MVKSYCCTWQISQAEIWRQDELKHKRSQVIHVRFEFPEPLCFSLSLHVYGMYFPWNSLKIWSPPCLPKGNQQKMSIVSQTGQRKGDQNGSKWNSITVDKYFMIFIRHLYRVSSKHTFTIYCVTMSKTINLMWCNCNNLFIACERTVKVKTVFCLITSNLFIEETYCS